MQLNVSIFPLIFQFEETNQLKQLQDNKVLPPISNEKFQKYGIAKKDEAHFERMFRKILKVRIPGTDGSRQVRQVKKSTYLFYGFVNLEIWVESLNYETIKNLLKNYHGLKLHVI